MHRPARVLAVLTAVLVPEGHDADEVRRARTCSI
jgi:hypothetical protein